MEKLNLIRTYVTGGIGIAGSIIANWYGGWTEDLTTLLILMGVDFTTGLIIAAIWKKSEKSKNGALSSNSAWKGLCKKGVSLLIILIAYRLDLALEMNYIKTAVTIAFIVNELISIIENAGIMGIPLPKIFTKAIDILKDKIEGEMQ